MKEEREKKRGPERVKLKRTIKRIEPDRKREKKRGQREYLREAGVIRIEPKSKLGSILIVKVILKTEKETPLKVEEKYSFY